MVTGNKNEKGNGAKGQMNYYVEIILTIISGICIAFGFGVSVVMMLSMAGVEISGYYTDDEKIIFAMGGILLGLIGIIIYKKVPEDEVEEQNK